MLSRTADHLFWMARYIERAENTARMLDINYQMSLLPQSSEQAEQGWRGMLSISELTGEFLRRHAGVNPREVMDFMVRDESNPSSIHSCLRAARENARAVRDMLAMAAQPGGTATRAQTMGYSVGGKSGTARKQEGRGYAGNKYRAWFVGIAPISQPRIVVAVMVDEPGTGVYYGGEVAAPVFSQVVQQTLHRLGVLPDIEVQSQIQTSIPSEVESF